MNWLNIPKKLYFKRGAMNVALKELDEVYNFKRAFIVSDAKLYRDGAIAPVNDWIRNRGIKTAEFFTIDAVPSFANVRSGLPKMLEFEPDVIIGVGGGSVMSVAKAMWLLYENPDLDLNDVAKKFNSTKVEYSEFPNVGEKAHLVLIATTAGTGAECSPFSVLADDKGKQQVIASYKLLPEIAIVDANFSDSMPADLTKKSGLTALTQAVRAYTSKGVNEYTQGFAREAVEGVLENLETAVSEGTPDARYKMANAAVLAGIAFSNSIDTIDTKAGLYPDKKEKNVKDLSKDELAAIVDLAKHVGIKGSSDDKIFSEWISAIEKLEKL